MHKIARARKNPTTRHMRVALANKPVGYFQDKQKGTKEPRSYQDPRKEQKKHIPIFHKKRAKMKKRPHKYKKGILLDCHLPPIDQPAHQQERQEEID